MERLRFRTVFVDFESEKWLAIREKDCGRPFFRIEGPVTGTGGTLFESDHLRMVFDAKQGPGLPAGVLRRFL